MTGGIPARPRMLVLGCGAVARELRQVIGRIAGADITLECLPGILHNTPDRIAPAVGERLERAASEYDRVLVGYADCGTGGRLDRIIESHPNVERIPGAHCYEFFSGSVGFDDINDPFTFYLTDYLARHFDLFVWRGLGLDRWPHLRDEYFANYRRLVYLSQTPSEDLIERALEAARRLDLEFEHVHTGLGPLEQAVGAPVQGATA